MNALLLAPIAALWNRPPAGAVENPRTTTLRRFAAGLATTLVFASLIDAGEVMRNRSRAAPYPKVFFQRGVNFTAENGYDPQPALPILDQLKTHGVNAIALVPYGFSRANEPVIHYPGGMERSDHIEALTILAHQRGIKVLLKPQLWTHSGFPGNIDWPDARQRARWFAEYRKFLEYYAGLAARIHADLFSVGVELGKLTPYEAEWRALIARARQLYPGPLVYSATQGPEFENIRFWDALDYIGLNEYYPLPDDLSTAAVVRTVEAVQNKFGKPVIFTEAGFSTYAHPNRAPWDETPRTLAPGDQARCYEAVFKAFYKKPWFQG
ncbi:MAG: hypothetical protein JWO48_753, partial [Bryobacterales bacterium]|nr:hypothetical protein [Bryobacterales bacterium]